MAVLVPPLLYCDLLGVFAGDAGKSVTEGESVTLEIDVNTDNEIQWRFGHKDILIALINREGGFKGGGGYCSFQNISFVMGRVLCKNVISTRRGIS